MEHASYTPCRLENARFGKRGVTYTALAFAILFVSCCVIGATGPDVFADTKFEAMDDDDGGGGPVGDDDGKSAVRIPVEDGTGEAEWRGLLTDMTPLDQMISVTAQMRRNDTEDTQKRGLDMQLTLIGGGDKTIVNGRKFERVVSCEKDADWCDEVRIFTEYDIAHSKYDVDIIFEAPSFLQNPPGYLTVSVNVVQIDPRYTTFEMTWKYAFLVVTLAVLFLPGEGYIVRLRSINTEMWSYQQKWVLALSLGLLAFNDPFFAAQVYSKQSSVWITLHTVMLSTFIFGILLFWLCIMDEMRASARSSFSGSGREGMNLYAKHDLAFYLPKIFLIFCIWALLIAIFLYVRLEQSKDLTYNGIGDSNLEVAEGALGVFMGIYTLWLFYLVAQASMEVRALPLPFFFVFFLTIFTLITTIVGIFIGAFYPVSSAAVEFLAFYALFNLYVWTLAFSYAPLRPEGSYAPQGSRGGTGSSRGRRSFEMVDFGEEFDDGI